MRLFLTALRAGLLAWLSATLLIVLALTPWWAAQSEFPGHEHPPDTPDHVHQLQEVGAEQAFSTVVTAVMITLVVLGTYQESALVPLRNQRRWPGVISRAPPAEA